MLNHNSKHEWCQRGMQYEDDFVKGRSFVDVDVRINPEKDQDVFTYDMRIDMPCDLKTSRTPWRRSMEMFGIDPKYAVSLNRKDLIRYDKLYPNIIIILDIGYADYKATHWTHLQDMKRLIKEEKVQLHKYKERAVGDEFGNAKDSYIFDVRITPIMKG